MRGRINKQHKNFLHITIMGTVTKKIQLQNDVFEGISSVFAVKGGLPFADNACDLTSVDLNEFPVSDDSGFNFDTGQPSIEHFKVKGMNADWMNTFTPGDGELTLEIPCHETNIMDMVFGQTGKNVTMTLPAGVGQSTTASGKGYVAAQKAIYLGLVILNDTEDKILFIQKAKFMAQAIFDGSNKPLCVVIIGAIAAATDNAFGVLDIAAPTAQTGGDAQTGDGN